MYDLKTRKRIVLLFALAWFLCLARRVHAQSTLYVNDNSQAEIGQPDDSTYLFTNTTGATVYFVLEDVNGAALPNVGTIPLAVLSYTSGSYGVAAVSPGQSIVFAFDGSYYQLPDSNGAFVVYDPGTGSVKMVGGWPYFDINGNPSDASGNDLNAPETLYGNAGSDGLGDDAGFSTTPLAGQSGISLTPGSVLPTFDPTPYESLFSGAGTVIGGVALLLAAVCAAVLVWLAIRKFYGKSA